MFCFKCGTQLPDSSAFCSACGVKIGDAPSLATTYTLTIDRDSQLFLTSPPIKIQIGNDVRMSLNNGESQSIDLPAGEYDIVFTASFAKKRLTVDLQKNTVIGVRFDRLKGGIAVDEPV